MTTELNPSDLEQLFIEKLLLKYKLTERDLKKAFSRFDKDGNGQLDTREVGIFVSHMLNGVSGEQIRGLVRRFDLNGDGKISCEEFLKYLLKRRDARATDVTTASSFKSSRTSEIPSRRSTNSEGYVNSRSFDIPTNHRRVGAISNGKEERTKHSNSTSDSARCQTHFSGDSEYKLPNYVDDRSVNYYNDQTSVADIDEDEDEELDDFEHSKSPTVQGALRLPTDYSHGKASYSQRPSSAASVAQSDAGSNFEPTNATELEYRCKIFLENLRSHLNKKVMSMREENKLPHHLTMSNRELLEKTGCFLLSKAFQSYTGTDSNKLRPRKEGQLIEHSDFIRVLRGFRFPGFAAVRVEVLQYLFELCRHSPLGSGSGSGSGLKGTTAGRWDLAETDKGRADTDHLCDLLYGESVRSIRHQQLPRNQAPPAVGEQAGQRVTDQDTLKSYADRANLKRTDLARGPLKPSQSQSQSQAGDGGKEGTSIHALPPSASARPSSFSAPSSSSSTVGGKSRGSVQTSSQGESARSGRLGANTNTNTNLVYASAALGVVHNISTNSQTLFAGHDDDITCIALSTSGALAATGQTGKSPVVHIWRTTPSSSSSSFLSSSSSAPSRKSGGPKPDSSTADGECDLVLSVGRGFFSRSVCAVAFSWDDSYLAAVGCDDHHTMGIWSIPAGELLVQSVCQNGLPPQIKDLKWSPGQQHTEFITREHKGPCNLLCTAGERHLRVWSFASPKAASSATVVAGISMGPQPLSPCSLAYRGAVMGKSKATAAKVYTCCVFVACDERGDKSFDMIAGGSNGVVYLWRAGELAAFTNAIKGGVTCMHAPSGINDKVFCGGAGGIIKVLDSRTLSQLATFSSKISSPPQNRSRESCWEADSATGGAAPSSRPSTPLSTAASLMGRPQSASTDGGRNRAASTGRLRPPSATPAEASRSKFGDIINHAPVKTADVLLAAVTGIVVIQGIGQSSASQSLAQAQSLYAIVTCADGRAVRVDVGGALSMSSTTSKNIRSGSSSDRSSSVPVKDLFFFHTASVWGVATERKIGATLVATVGEDKMLCVWDTDGFYLTCRYSNFIAVGFTNGSLSMYSHLAGSGPSPGPVLTECSFRKDFHEEVTDIKFSPNNELLAAGSRDNFIIVYSCVLSVNPSKRNDACSGSCVLRPLHKLKGHSAYITHFDWSIDSRLIRSNCGAYELLFWDAESGKRCFDSNCCDIRWKTNTCVLGFQVMGIWPKYADGTDINALDVSLERGVVATADDSGYLNILNYPSVVQEAPRKTYGGHSSFVQNVRFLPAPAPAPSGGDPQRPDLVTVGGDDCAVIVWKLRDTIPRGQPR